MQQTETAPSEATVETPTVVDSAEAQLVSEVGNLWQVHTQAQTSLHKTREELKLIRANLSRRLHELKAVLSRPGRGGAWSSFLGAQKIPRSTADRLVRTHEKTLTAEGRNCASEHIEEPNEVVVRRYVHALWPKLSRVLRSHDSIEAFIVELRRMAGKSFGADVEVPNPSLVGSAAQQ
jgi:hypothetical protein